MKGMKSRFFKAYEFACKCGCGFGGTPGDVDWELVSVLDDIRDHFNVGVIINSGCRCPAHNAAEGGKPDSQHIQGTAADIKTRSVTPKQIHEYLTTKYPDRYGIGLYPTWVHIDTRAVKARW